MQTFVYPARFERGEKAGILVVTFRDVPEAITHGKGEKDAVWREVRRMLDPRHPTKLPRIQEALEVLGKRLIVGVEAAA